MRACAQPGLAVRAVSAIGAHLELAGRLGMVGLGILRSPDTLHSLGLRTEGHSLSRPCASQQGWRRSVVWVSSEQPKRAAVAQLRQASLPVLRHVQWKHLRAARPPRTRHAARDEPGPRASRDPVLGGKSRTKRRTPENAYGFVELIPRLYHLTKGSSWEHSGGRLKRFLNTFRSEVVRATGGIRLTASGPVLVQQPAAAGRVRASWQRRAYACGCACCLRKRTPSSMCCASQ